MSTVKVVNVQHPSAATPAVTLASDGSMTGAFPAPNRNLLYNGAMQVAQRGTSTASITESGYRTADRWNFLPYFMGTWTQTIENDAPTGSGLRKSLKVLCTTADSSPAAGETVWIDQRLEGQDVQRIAKGTASAQQLTLSFWVKSNVTGTYIAELQDVDNTRTVSASYTVSASATWERKTITFPADTTGAFDNDNAASLQVNWWLGSGSSYTSGSLATAWAAKTDANRAVGQTNLAAATNNYWQVTGVQLEVGPVATGFEFKSYGQELRECQRYYQKSYDSTTVPGTATRDNCIAVRGINSAINAQIFFKTTMRAKPGTVTFYSPVTGSSGVVRNLSTGNDVSIGGVLDSGDGQMSTNASGATNDLYLIHYAVSAEL